MSNTPCIRRRSVSPAARRDSWCRRRSPSCGRSSAATGLGSSADDLRVAGAAQMLHQRAVVAADVDRLARILAGDRRGDQVVEMPRPLEAGRVGVGLAVDQVGGDWTHDLQQAAVLAAVEVDREARIRVFRALPQVVGDRQVIETEKDVRGWSPQSRQCARCSSSLTADCSRLHADASAGTCRMCQRHRPFKKLQLRVNPIVNQYTGFTAQAD